MNYPFTEAQAKAAYHEWGCNCGPTAMAFALQVGLEAVRHAIPDFATKRYTSPTMMKAGLEFLGRNWYPEKVPAHDRLPVDVEPMFASGPNLVRVQWTGPWTAGGANPRWAYRQSHWITTWRENGVPLVFDVNGGIRGISSWIDELVPIITAGVKRADGGWYPTHIWRVLPRPGVAA